MNVYIAADGDDIGRRLERLLLSDNAEAAAAFSRAVNDALAALRSQIESLGGTVIFAGGDSLLAICPDECVGEVSSRVDSFSWSFGVGSSPSRAVLALKRAKGLGRNRTERLDG